MNRRRVGDVMKMRSEIGNDALHTNNINAFKVIYMVSEA